MTGKTNRSASDDGVSGCGKWGARQDSFQIPVEVFMSSEGQERQDIRGFRVGIGEQSFLDEGIGQVGVLFGDAADARPVFYLPRC